MSSSKFVVFLIGFTIIHSSAAWFEYCNNQVPLVANSSIYINSPYYPSKYPSGSSCKYTIVAPLDYQINIQCQINFDKDPNGCSTEFFYISTDGSSDLQNSEYNCGSGYIQRRSLFNSMVIAYTSSSRANGGAFSCYATAVPQPCDCGWSVNSKIVGGVETTKNEFPFMAGIVYFPNKKIFCGATIISHWHLLTAAHCFEASQYTNVANLGVVVGEHDVTVGNESPYTALLQVQRILRHNLYQPTPQQPNDIAIVTTVQTIAWSRGVGPACLPFLYSQGLFNGYQADIVGWGTTSFGGPTSNVLRKATTNIMTNAQCQPKFPQLMASQMCTYAPNKDSCQSDSGGPLIVRFSRLFLVGIISYGLDCAGPDPSVNTRITSYLSWIQANTGVQYCQKG